MNNNSVIHMWKEYQKINPQAPLDYDIWAFGNSKEMADELAGLVLEGKKTATASNYILYELEQEALPYVGEHNVILDGNGTAVAILETTSVEVVPFNEVTEEQAYLEGEGDRTLQYWRDVHEDFFKRELEEINQEFHEQILVVCEKMKLVFK